ncbi:MAG: hypothetical protein ACREO0_10760, partial [Pseudoxanthomonas sp.]
TGRRRRGRRGGRRRRRGTGEAGTGNETGGSEDFGDDEQPQVIIANGSQPEFDFDDETPAAKPVVARPAAAQASAAPVVAVAAAAPVVAVETPRPAPVTVTPEPESPVVAASAVAPVETPQPAVALAPTPPVELRTESVAQTTEPVVIATPAEASVAAQETLKNDTVESFTLVENPAPVEAASIAVQAAPEIAPEVVEPPAPAPVAAVEPPKPAPARPAVGNTGSLFFTADADTPSSVTRHLFEPMPTPQPAAVVEKHEEQDLPLLADNDETAGGEKDRDSERSA